MPRPGWSGLNENSESCMPFGCVFHPSSLTPTVFLPEVLVSMWRKSAANSSVMNPLGGLQSSELRTTGPNFSLEWTHPPKSREFLVELRTSRGVCPLPRKPSTQSGEVRKESLVLDLCQTSPLWGTLRISIDISFYSEISGALTVAPFYIWRSRRGVGNLPVLGGASMATLDSLRQPQLWKFGEGRSEGQLPIGFENPLGGG